MDGESIKQYLQHLQAVFEGNASDSCQGKIASLLSLSYIQCRDSEAAEDT